MTTRIRINIPGSRPIPPVVMRKPVGEGEDDSGSDRDAGSGTARTPRGSKGPASGPGAGPAGAGDSTPTSDWFAPRRTPRSAPEPEPERGRAATPSDGFPALDADVPDARPHSGSDLLDGPPPPSPPRAPGDRTTGPRTGDMPVPPAAGGTGAARRLGERPLVPPPGPDAGYDPFGRPTTSGSPGPATFPGPGTRPGDDRIGSDTLVSGIPRVPSSVDSVFPPDAPPPQPSGHGYFDDDRPEADDVRDRGDREESGRKGKGRSKLVLAAVSLIGVIAIAYGAGLLLDHADVPKGTTVLGVDIGGQTQQDAVNALDAALKGRITDPLTVVVDGKEQQIEPEVLGLTVDTQETVRAASGRDYNPVSVISSLFGGARVVDAQVQVDDEKLRSAVAGLSREAVPGAAGNGSVVFTGGTAKAVPGKPHKAVDVTKAVTLIEDAYRSRAASGQDAPVVLPVGVQQPKFGEKELQAAVDGFGKSAMSGWVWVKAGDVELPFSQETIGTFLTMTAGDETLQPAIDLDKLAAAYGTAFDGVVIEGGAGTVPVQPKHVAAAMIDALRQPAPAPPEKRVAEVTASRSQ